MTFEQWFYEQEVYGTRSERFYDDLGNRTNSRLRKVEHYQRMKQWLESAYNQGYERGKQECQ
jgi:hypothetical protein